jgi:hypothetical protein
MQKLVTQDPKIKKFMATASPSERDAFAHMLMQQHGGDINMYTARKAMANPYTSALSQYLKTGASKFATQYHLNPSGLTPGSPTPAFADGYRLGGLKFLRKSIVGAHI